MRNKTKLLFVQPKTNKNRIFFSISAPLYNLLEKKSSTVGR